MVRRLLVITVIVLGVATASAARDRPFDPEPLLSQAITGVRQIAYRSGQVDWTGLEARVRAKAAGARDELDLLPAYAVLLNGLGDGHSFVQIPPERRKAYIDRHGRSFYAASGVATAQTPPQSTFITRRDREARTLRLAGRAEALLLVVPSVSGRGPDAQAYANGLFEALAAAAPKSCGYVLDLRGNTGGNMWPMVTGLSPLLGDGMGLGEEDGSGQKSVYGNLRGGEAIIANGGGAGNRLFAVEGWRDLGVTRAPVAILQDDGVMSSGEAVLAAFAGRRDTRTFGQRSQGLASANTGYQLADGTNLVITVGMMTDRNGRTYPGGFAPDEPVAAGPGLEADPDDAVVEAAKAWLGRQPACREG